MSGSMQRNLCILLIVLGNFGLLSGCAGIKPYSDKSEKNFLIHTKTQSDSFFSSVSTALDIYQVDTDCQGTYVGTVKLDRDKVWVGIPSSKTSYLRFRFDSGGFLSNSSSRITFETLIKPLQGNYYGIIVRYMEDIYNVEIREKRSPGAKGKEMLVYHLDECKKLTDKRIGSVLHNTLSS